MRKPRLTPVNRWLEPLLALLIVGGLIRAMIHLYINGYLPQPFFYEPADIWMDWFNTADWARDRGMYDAWQTIYPPLSFVFLKIAGLPICFIGGSGSGLTAYYSRDCDWLGVGMIHGIYILNAVLVAKTFMKIDRRTALPRSLAVAMGLPMTSALERGNLILVTFTCIVLAFGPLIKSARGRWVALGLAINFKIYLIATLFPQLLRRRWRWFEGAMIATVVIYIITYCLLGRGSPAEIYENVSGFTAGAGSILDAWIASTYNPILALANSSDFPANDLLGSRTVDIAVFAITTSLRCTQSLIVIAAIGAWLRPEAVTTHRLTCLGLVLSLITIDSQFYTVALLSYLVFMERWRGFGVKFAIVICYILAFSFDIILDRVAPVVRDTYFYGRTVLVTYYIMLGPFLRPGLIMAVAVGLASTTIHEVWVDIRTQGWRSRWRFRHDLPVMVGQGDGDPTGQGRRGAVTDGSTER